MPSRVWDEITYPFQTLAVAPLGIDKQFHPTHYKVCTFLTMLGLKLTHVSKKGYWWATNVAILSTNDLEYRCRILDAHT